MNAPTAPTELQLDALREVANVGIGQAATALSRLLGGRRVMLSVPHVALLPLREVEGLLGGAQAPLVAVSLEMTGGLRGQLLLALEEPHAQRLASALLGGTGALGEPGLNALREVANIAGSACLNAISHLTSLKLLPSPPLLERDVARVVVQRALAAGGAAASAVMVLEARMLLEGSPGVEGQLLIIPEAPSLRTLLSRLGV